MARAGDCYIADLKKSHLNWGEYRYTSTRDPIGGEAYIPIPVSIARQFSLYNSNATSGCDVLGKNVFNVRSIDNYLRGELKAQGSSEAGNEFAKQFSMKGDLKGLGEWFSYIGAEEGTRIKVEWITPYDIVLSPLE